MPNPWRNLLGGLLALAMIGSAAAPACARLRALWVHRLYELAGLELGRREFGTPSFARDGAILVVGDRKGMLWAFDARQGAVIWKRDLGDPVTMPPMALDRGSVLVGAGDGTLRRVDLDTGKDLWAEPLRSQGPFQSRPLLHGPLIVLQDGANRVLALTREGKFLFDVGIRPPEEFSLYGSSTPATDGRRLVVGFSDGTVAALDPIRGQRLWEHRLPSDSPRAADAQAGPVIRKGRVYVGSPQAGLSVLDVRRGTELARMKFPGLIHLIPAPEGEIYAFTWGGVVARLEPGKKALPKVAWTVRLQGDTGPPGLTADGVLTCDGFGLALLSRRTGRLRDYRSLERGCAGGVATAPGRVAHMTETGIVLVWEIYPDR